MIINAFQLLGIIRFVNKHQEAASKRMTSLVAQFSDPYCSDGDHEFLYLAGFLTICIIRSTCSEPTRFLCPKISHIGTDLFINFWSLAVSLSPGCDCTC